MTDANATDTELSPDRDFSVRRRLFFLEVSTNRIQAMNPDGSGRKVVVADCQLPDGIAIDVGNSHIYWTNMGSGVAVNDGSIERVNIDGSARKVIVPPGVTFTPKQIQIDQRGGKLYWCDREGMQVMRCNLDGSEIETLIEAGRGDMDRRDPTRWCIGVTIDTERRKIYWSQKVLTMPAGAESSAPTLTSPGVNTRQTAPTSRCCSMACRNRFTLNSIWRTACSIGPTAVILRVATQSIARVST